MKRIFILTLFSLTIPLIFGETTTHKRMKAKFDERIELMSTICHLANYPEYNMGMGGEYINKMDKYFSDYKNHRAVLMLDSLRRKNGFGFDSPMAFAIEIANYLNHIDSPNFIQSSHEVQMKVPDFKESINEIYDSLLT